MINSNEPFEYEGHLLFGVYEVATEEDLNLIDDVYEELAAKEHESPPQASTTIKSLEIEIPSEINVPLKKSFSESIGALRYIEKQYKETEIVVPDQEEPVTGYEVQEQSGEILMLDSDRLVVRGSKQIRDKITTKIESVFQYEARLIPLDFHPDFLLWLFQKNYQSTEIDRLRPITLTEAEFVGDEDLFGGVSNVQSTSLERSALAIQSILAGEQFTSIGGKFEFFNNFIDLKIQTDGSIHVRAADDIRESNQLERFVLATCLVDELGSLYLRWEQMPRSKKYPSPDFFEELYEGLQSEGVNVMFSMDDLIEEYINKRGGSKEDYL